MRSLLTMSNLFENVSDIYGYRETMLVAEQAGYRLFPSRELTCEDCLRFSNLAAEAFIREVDLRKGERVALCIPDPAEMLLVAVALIKAGGIALPLDCRLPASEIARRVQECAAKLAVVDGRALGERMELKRGLQKVDRLVVSGPRSQAPEGMPSLDRAMDLSSGFFLPYTLKPTNVVGLFYTVLKDGALKAVMLTNEGLLGPQRLLAALFPTRPGDGCVHAAAIRTAEGFASCVLGLCMGLRMRFVQDPDPQRVFAAVESQRPAALMASPDICASAMRAGAGKGCFSSIRLCFVSGEVMQQHMLDECRRLSCRQYALFRTPPWFIETYSAGGNATLLALKPALPFCAMRGGGTGLVIPPNRMRVVDEAGRRARRGEEGELVIKGPAVTPGYWNDIERTLKNKREGWLYTGIRARKNLLFIEEKSR